MYCYISAANQGGESFQALGILVLCLLDIELYDGTS